MNNKKTVVHITDGHSAFDDRIFYKELCSLAKKYDCCELTATNNGKFITNMSGKLLEQGNYEGVKCLAFKTGSRSFVIRCIRHFFPSVYNMFHIAKSSRQICRILKNNGITPDLIHFHDLSFAPVALKLKQKIGCKLIFDSHEFFFVYPFNLGLSKKTCKKAEKELLKWSKAIRCSDFAIGCTRTMDNLMSIIRHDDNHGIIYNSSMFEMNTNMRRLEPGKKIVLLHEGSMPFNRGLKLMLEMFRDEYIRGHFQLRIVGTVKGAEKQYFEEKCCEYNLTDENIYFTGWVDYLEVPKALQGDIGILFFEKSLNTFYSMPNKLFNYHVAGVPVLATHCADLSDIIEQLGTGVVVERNVDAVKKGLMELAEHYGEYQTRVLKHQKEFHWSTDDARLFEIYENILG